MVDSTTSILQSFVDRIVKQQKATDVTSLDDVVVLENMVKDMLLNLHCLHNRLAPVHRLPSEVLCIIFEFGSDDLHSPSRQSQNTIAFSHVCQQWRDTAISYPPMWIQPDMASGSINLLRLFIERSKNAPLYLAFGVPKEEVGKGKLGSPLENIDLLVEHNTRISSITIDANDCSGPLLQRLNFAAPVLELFSCTFNLDSEEGPMFPADFFGRHIPKLKVVHLTRVHLGILEHFSNLAQLSIRGGERGNGFLLLDLLERSPLLKRLTLADFNCDTDIRHRPSIRLKELTYLILERTSGRALLSFLEAPNLVAVDIVDPNRHGTDTTLSYLPENPLALGITKNLDSVSIVNGPARFALTGHDWKARLRAFKLEMDSDAEVAVDVWGYLSQASLDRVLNIALYWSPESPAPSADMIFALFANVPTIRILTFMFGNWNAFLQPLIDNDDLCPELGAIQINIDLSTYMETFRIVETLVRTRKKAGRTVQIEHAITTGKDDNLSRLWNTLCAEHGISFHEAMMVTR